MNNELRLFRIKMREAIADYMQSEGCSCCSDYDAHQKHASALGKLLGVKPHPKEKDYYDFSKYRSRP